MYYKSIMKRRYDWCKLKNTRTHKTLSLPPPTLGTSLSMAPQGWPVGLLPDSITDWTQGATLGNGPLPSVGCRIQWKHIHHLRKRKAFFQDLFGCDWTSLQNEEVWAGMKWDTLEKRMVPTWGACEVMWLTVTRCWRPVCVPWFWYLTTPVHPGPGCSCPLTFGDRTLPREPTSSNFRGKVSAWGPICKIGCFSVWKNKQGKQSPIT